MFSLILYSREVLETYMINIDDLIRSSVCISILQSLLQMKDGILTAESLQQNHDGEQKAEQRQVMSQLSVVTEWS